MPNGRARSQRSRAANARRNRARGRALGRRTAAAEPPRIIAILDELEQGEPDIDRMTAVTLCVIYAWHRHREQIVSSPGPGFCLYRSGKSATQTATNDERRLFALLKALPRTKFEIVQWHVPCLTEATEGERAVRP